MMDGFITVLDGYLM